jgi:hypothetical protein
MKKVLGILAGAAALMLAACNVKVASSSRRNTSVDPLILRAHFIGTEQLFAAPQSSKMKEAWNIKTAVAFRREALDRFALLPSFWLGENLPKGAPTQTNLFRPLLEDVFARECYLECTAKPDFLLAVHVSDARARIWQTNLWQALANWKLGAPVAAKLDSASGFESKRAGVPGVFRFLRAGEWIVVSASSGTLARETEMLASIKTTGRPAPPTGAWLDGDANLARFDGWLPVLANFENLPTAHFSVSNRADFVRTYATLDFAKPHGWKPEPWQIPSNHIHEPLISFLAARGTAPLFESLKPLRDLGYKPTPNQIIGWGHGSLPFQFNYATPSGDVTNQLKKVKPKMAEMVLGPGGKRMSGEFEWQTNSHQIIWQGLPVAVPHLSEMRDSGREFLVFAALPPMRATNKAPAELYQAFAGRDELVAFDFEITQFRIPHWRQFYQLAEIASRRTLTATNTPFQQWLIEITPLFERAPQLGEAVTELRATSPTQMTLVRKSFTGLTAGELVTLGRWLESTNFPSFGVFLPQASKRLPGTRDAAAAPRK